MTSSSETAKLLTELIAHPTQQAGPDRGPGDELALCRYLAPRLTAAGAQVTVREVRRQSGDPGAYLYATWGRPRRVINAHLDTVPANRGWSRDPWTPAIADGRVWGLGAADTKGAIAAAVIAAEKSRPRDLALLFSGDEEHGTACVHAFLQSEAAAGIEQVIVCEPTGRRAGLAHRGVLASRATLVGEGGHSSKADSLQRPIAKLARLATALDDRGLARRDDGPPQMRGLCLNVAGLDGGVAFNVVPTRAVLTWSLRPWPGFDAAAWHAEVAAIARIIDPRIEIALDIDHAPFSCAQPEPLRALVGGHVSGFEVLAFWTEAALWAEAGVHAVVVGPGDIAQAHCADEWVAVADLDWAVDLFSTVMTAG